MSKKMFLQALIIAGGIILSSFQASALCTQSSSGGVSCTCDDELPTCTNGETIQYNGSQWVCAAGGSNGIGTPVDIKVTSASNTGNFGGWAGLQTFLDNNGCSGYKICTETDITRYLIDGNTITASGWVAVSFDAGGTDSNCQDWTHELTSGGTGHYWMSSPQNTIRGGNFCGSSRRVVCCKF